MSDPSKHIADAVEAQSDQARAPLAVWLPTADGAILRSTVVQFHVEHIEGSFKGGETGAWFVYVRTDVSQDPIRLRPLFLDPHLLRLWVDQVFPGAFFEIMEPENMGLEPRGDEPHPDSTQLVDDGSPHMMATWMPPSVPGPGGRLGGQIAAIGNALAGGNAYEPPQNYRPPPGTVVAI